jgi:hypothetical protein
MEFNEEALGVKAMVMENSMLPGLEVGSGCCVMK